MTICPNAIPGSFIRGARRVPRRIGRDPRGCDPVAALWIGVGDGQVASNPKVPAIRLGGVVSSFASPAALGMLISIFGSALADGSARFTMSRCRRSLGRRTCCSPSHLLRHAAEYVATAGRGAWRRVFGAGSGYGRRTGLSGCIRSTSRCLLECRLARMPRWFRRREKAVRPRS